MKRLGVEGGDFPAAPGLVLDDFCWVAVRRGPGGYVLRNYVCLQGGGITALADGASCVLQAAEATPRALGLAVCNIIDWDVAHRGSLIAQGDPPGWKELCEPIGKGAARWNHAMECLVSQTSQGFHLSVSVPSLRGWDTDSRVGEGEMDVDSFDPEILGRALLDVYDRVDAWCARNGRNPRTGMPCPLRENLGGDGVLVLTPPAYFEEEYHHHGHAVIREYFYHPDAHLPVVEVTGEEWLNHWKDGIAAWLCWRVVQADDADGLLEAWQAAHGRAVEASSMGCEGEPGAGCFSSRGVVSNRSWASYWFRRTLASGDVLELVLDVKQPGRRKRLAGKAVKAWERCARHTQLLPPDNATGTQA